MTSNQEQASLLTCAPTNSANARQCSSVRPWTLGQPGSSATALCSCWRALSWSLLRLGFCLCECPSCSLCISKLLHTPFPSSQQLTTWSPSLAAVWIKHLLQSDCCFFAGVFEGFCPTFACFLQFSDCSIWGCKESLSRQSMNSQIFLIVHSIMSRSLTHKAGCHADNFPAKDSRHASCV